MKNLLAFAFAALFLASCTAAPPSTAVPDLTFDNVEPVTLSVAGIEVENEYIPAMQPPNIDHMFKTPPLTATRRLLEKQLVAGGGLKRLRVVIEDARVVDEPVPVTEGFTGLFRQEPSNIYKATVSIRFELYDPATPDIIEGNAEVIAQRNRTIMKDYSPAERDRAAFELTESLMKDVSNGLRTTVRKTFGAQ